MRDENTYTTEDARRLRQWNDLEEAATELHATANDLRRLGRTGWASDIDRIAYDIEDTIR